MKMWYKVNSYYLSKYLFLIVVLSWPTLGQSQTSNCEVPRQAIQVQCNLYPQGPANIGKEGTEKLEEPEGQDACCYLMHSKHHKQAAPVKCPQYGGLKRSAQ